MKPSLQLPLGLLIILLSSCHRPPAESSSRSPQPSFGEALESSLSASATEEKNRSLSRQRQQQIQDQQKKLQQDRLKSYTGGTP